MGIATTEDKGRANPSARSKTMRSSKEPAEKAGLPKMMTSIQVAEALGVDRSTLSRWRSQGVGPRVYWLAKSCPRYREDDVLEWLERNAA
jgi:predicted DNA-binding transcriptional regulator AlpA